MRRRKKSLGRWILKMVLQLALIGVLLFGLAMGALCFAENHLPEARLPADAIIVLGAQVYADGTLSLQLQSRMEAALAAYWESPCEIITCGAQGGAEPCPEGDAMRNWLIRQGVPEQSVIAETQSHNTRQNLENAKALLPEGARHVVIVTSDYHLPRAMAIARDLGFSADGIGSPCKPEYWLKNHSREVLAWGKYLMGKVIPRQ